MTSQPQPQPQPQPQLHQHLQDEVHRRSLSDPASFWAEQAAQLHWHKKPSSILDRSTKTLTTRDGKGRIEHPDWEWFRGGEISTCYNCVDRHVRAGHGDQPAIYYDSPVTGDGNGGGVKQTITYAQLLDEVEVAAGALREEVS